MGMERKWMGHINHEEGSFAVLAEKVSRIYSLGATEVVGVQDIDLQITKGQLVVIKGESGSGKSTLLALVAGLDRPTGGRLMVAGVRLEQASARGLTDFRRKSVGIIFQSFNLLPTLTVVENVCLPALLAGKSHAHVGVRAMELLDWLGLKKRLAHFPSQLSGGEMQRTAIARALINDPAIILADEPTGNLDSKNGIAVIELLTEMNRKLGRTVIIATHGVLADSQATASILLKDGIIVEHRIK